jgi:molecular chaperone GrpE
MSFWDPYDRHRREQQRRLMEQRRRAEQQEAERRARAAQERSAGPPGLPPNLIARFEEELAKARRERDELADRYQAIEQELAREREALAAEREQWEAEREEQRTLLAAEADNQRERLLRNAEQRAFEETRAILTRLLDVADDLGRALSQVDEEETTLASGVRLTHRNFERVLAQAGVERLESVGEAFDPALHEAVAAREGEAESNTVVEEVAPGYTYRGSLLRPARVVVAS